MAIHAHPLSAILLCLALSGCTIKLNGNQSTSGGTATTSTSGQVGGSASFAGGKASFSSGQSVSPHARGGYLSLGKGASAVLIVGLVFADLVNTLVGETRPRALPADAKIMETCSCYKKVTTDD